MTLGPKTLLVGPSGSGKSAVVQAIECQLLGQASDLLGRATVQKPDWLRTLTHDGEPPDVEVFADPPGLPAVELYRETEDLLRAGPFQCLAGLLRVPGRVVGCGDPVALLDTARALLGAFYAEAGEEPPARFLRWFTDRREQACCDAERQTTRDRAMWTELVRDELPALYLRAARYAPGLTFSTVHQTLRVGLRGRYALSGAEWVQVVTALACARARPDTLNLVVPADRAVDPTTLSAWMAALTPAPVQVLLTAVQEPPEPVPGWTVVRFPLASRSPPRTPPSRAARVKQQVARRRRRGQARGAARAGSLS